MATALTPLLSQFRGPARKEARSAFNLGDFSFFSRGDQRQLARQLFRDQNSSNFPEPDTTFSPTADQTLFDPGLISQFQETNLRDDPTAAGELVSAFQRFNPLQGLSDLQALNRVRAIFQRDPTTLAAGTDSFDVFDPSGNKFLTTSAFQAPPPVVDNTPALVPDAIIPASNPPGGFVAPSFPTPAPNPPGGLTPSPPPTPQPFSTPGTDPNFSSSPGPTDIPGPATETLQTLFPLDSPAAGGPTFDTFKTKKEDELSRLINERLGSIISGEGLSSTAAPGLNDQATTGLNALANQASQSNLPNLPNVPKQPRQASPSGDIPIPQIGQSGQQGLQELIDNGGLDPELIFQVRKSLRENTEGQLRAQQAALEDALAERRLTGGGTELSSRFDIRERLAAEAARNLRDFATQLALSAQDRALAASTEAGRLGEAIRGQDVQVRGQDVQIRGQDIQAAQAARGQDVQIRGQDIQAAQTARAQSIAAAQAVAQAGIQLRAQDIQAVQQDLNAQLNAISGATGRALGIADVALRSQIANQDFIQFLMSEQTRRAQFLEAVASQRQGDSTQILRLLLDFVGQLQQGQVK